MKTKPGKCLSDKLRDKLSWCEEQQDAYNDLVLEGKTAKEAYRTVCQMTRYNCFEPEYLQYYQRTV